MDYWCFCETAFGTQYGYRIDELTSGQAAPVYSITGILPHRVEASSFREFLEVMAYTYKGDWFDDELIGHFGEIPPKKHLAYDSPTGFLEAGEMYDISRIVLEDPVSNMICKGDEVSCYARRPDEIPAGFEYWRDELGRKRLRILY